MRVNYRKSAHVDDVYNAHADKIAGILSRLRQATISVEKVIFGELVNSPLRAVIKPALVIESEWSSDSERRRDCEVRLSKLDRLTGIFNIDCVELAGILLTRPKLDRKPKSQEVVDAARAFLGQRNGLPHQVLDPYGVIVLEEARASGDAQFLRKVRDHIRNSARKPPGKRSQDDDSEILKRAIKEFWAPVPKINWPGLAYCKEPAQRNFLEKIVGCHIPYTKTETNRNSLYTLAERLDLKAAKIRFISHIVDKNGELQFS
jgi:hypothetical protein